MIQFVEKDGAITVSVRVAPRASRSEIVGEHNGALRVRIAAPPVDGAANENLVHTLAKALGVPRGGVEIMSGHQSKNKTVRIRGIDRSRLERLIKVWTK